MIQKVVVLSEAAVPTTPDDVLTVEITTDTVVEDTVFLRAIQILEDGTVVPGVSEIPIVANQGTYVLTLRLTDGILANLSLSLGGASVPTGSIFATVYIRRGSPATPNQRLFLTSGYISDDTPLTYPDNGQVSQTEAGTYGSLGTNPAPAVGTDILVNLYSGTPCTIYALSFTFTASAAVANRRITITLGMLGETMWVFRTRTNITANQVWRLCASTAGSLPDDDATAFLMYFPIPSPCRSQQIQLITTTAAIDAGDQYSAVNTIGSNSTSI